MIKKIFPFLLLTACLCCACTQAFKPFTFVQMTDTQIGFMDRSEGYAHSDSLFRAAAKSANEAKPDLVVITGDLVDNTADPDQNRIFETDLKLIEAPVWCLPGNHDYDKTWSESIRDRFVSERGQERFSFRHKGCVFIGLDTNCIMEEPGAAEETEQWNWLVGELTKARRTKYVFVFIHCPIFRQAIDERDDYSNFPPAKREKYISLFKDFGVDVVFSGHTHYDLDFEYEGIRFVTANPVGNPIGKGHPGYYLVAVGKDGVTVTDVPTVEIPQRSR